MNCGFRNDREKQKIQQFLTVTVCINCVKRITVHTCRCLKITVSVLLERY